MAVLEKLVAISGGTLACTQRAAPDFNLCLSLPLPLAHDDGVLPAVVASSPVTGDSLAPASNGPVTILIADDQPALVSVVRNYLESLGFGVITARDGQEAVQQVFAHHPQLVLIDVRMPVLGGLEAIRKIRESSNPSIRATAIISLSGLAGAGDKEKCLAAGASDYINKPFGIKELDDVIAKFVNSPDEHGLSQASFRGTVAKSSFSRENQR
ncbi:response regulator [Prosthecobacter sp.]|uniref:response regulator n=1 Tax=Prosthecobacter sp. TaxID=1965333 RepID=UPI0025FA9735|nr:response regulator [Prosthecobacter sp.]